MCGEYAANAGLSEQYRKYVIFIEANITIFIIKLYQHIIISEQSVVCAPYLSCTNDTLAARSR